MRISKTANVSKFSQVLLYATLSVATAYLASELADHLGQTFPKYAQQIRHWMGLILVLVIGGLFLRPMFLLYMDKDSK